MCVCKSVSMNERESYGESERKERERSFCLIKLANMQNEEVKQDKERQSVCLCMRVHVCETLESGVAKP